MELQVLPSHQLHTQSFEVDEKQQNPLQSDEQEMFSLHLPADLKTNG